MQFHIVQYLALGISTVRYLNGLIDEKDKSERHLSHLKENLKQLSKMHENKQKQLGLHAHDPISRSSDCLYFNAVSYRSIPCSGNFNGSIFK
jgi:hydroxypyruvate isomerase